ncbi:MAG TPA: AAA family ATPase, partial [Longimicrobiales bacterium]|nr:AAA family ATPase [Longimicrobiales bacterium]
MEFRRIRIGAFGALRELDTGREPLTRLVVVLGPNEGGKSTLFHFLTSMIYGFYPASRDRNPYAPWEGGDIDGRAWLRLEDGEAVEIHRRLLSSPTATLVRGTVSEDLRNRTLPFAEHVPREVFRQVFALTLAELAALEGESWDRVQDRLVTGMGASDLASIRSAAEALEREAGRLWRPSRMGNQEVRDLRERMRDLRLRRRTASDSDRRLREAARERDRVARELREARKERQACHLYVERCQTLLPLRERLRRIDELLERAGPLEELQGLPADPEEALAALEAEARELRDRRRTLEGDAMAPRDRLEAFGVRERDVLEREAEIREAVARVAGSEPLRVRAAQLRQKIRDLRRRRDDTARELLTAPWSESLAEPLLAVPGVRLRTAVEEYREARETRRLVEERVGRRAGGRELPAWIGPALAASGGILLVVAAVTGWTVAGFVGAVTAGMGGALLLVRHPDRRDPAGDGTPSQERLRKARNEEATALAGVDRLLAGLPVREELREHPPADLGIQVQRLQELVGDGRD